MGERFDELFDSDVVCCNEGSQITHFGELELFKEVKSFIKELLKSEKEKNRQKFIETIEDVCKGLPFIQRQLKEAIKDEK